MLRLIVLMISISVLSSSVFQMIDIGFSSNKGPWWAVFIPTGLLVLSLIPMAIVATGPSKD